MHFLFTRTCNLRIENTFDFSENNRTKKRTHRGSAQNAETRSSLAEGTSSLVSKNTLIYFASLWKKYHEWFVPDRLWSADHRSCPSTLRCLTWDSAESSNLSSLGSSLAASFTAYAQPALARGRDVSGLEREGGGKESVCRPRMPMYGYDKNISINLFTYHMAYSKFLRMLLGAHDTQIAV